MKKQISKKEKQKTLITKDMTIIEILDKKPESIEVLMEFGLGCFGCAFSGMETTNKRVV